MSAKHALAERAVLLRSIDVAIVATSAAGLLGVLAATEAVAAPPIRTSLDNAVPACVTPDRLMAFLATRNPHPATRFRAIADYYRRHGSEWRVRWDYAFFQMALETNFLQFRRGDGRPGDVRPQQNNFAGLGTTGGGVPGDSYPDVSTGVLAQIQHLVAYSGERVPDPVGHRTRKTQDDVVFVSRRIAARRPVTFQDLSRRWAVDRAYGRSIDTLARLYAQQHCGGLDITVALKAQPPRLTANPRLATRAATHNTSNLSAAPQSIANLRRSLGHQPSAHQMMPTDAREASGSPKLTATSVCLVRQASFGGPRAVLIRHQAKGRLELTALGVEEGRESSMSSSFIASYAPGGVSLGNFSSRESALERAYALCPRERPPG